MDSTGKVAEAPQLPPQAASAAQISAVLGNDDILCEILVRLDFPTCLVRAAAVSKRWLRHASDPAFLRRFRRLHPLRLLGFYLDTSDFSNFWLRFVPLPHSPHPEVAAVIRRGKFDLGRGARHVSDCRNGRLIVDITVPDDPMMLAQKTLCRPLHPERGASTLPRPHIPALADGCVRLYSHELLFHDDGGDDMAAVTLVGKGNDWQVRVQLRDFHAGEWGEYRNSDLIQLPGQWKECRHSSLMAYGKIYMICMAQYILGLDIQSMSLFSIKLPNGVEYVIQNDYGTNIALPRAEGSGFCLVHVWPFQICVWRYTMDHSNTGNWELIDTISLRQVFGPNADPTWCSQGADVRVVVVGDNADFVFLRIQNKVFYLHISSRTLEKVYELAQCESLGERESLFGVYPFMMVWPPTFPTLNGGHDNDE